MSAETAPSGRAGLEWVTLIVSGGILAAVLVTLIVLAVQPQDPAQPTVSSDWKIEPLNDQFVVFVEVHNDGDAAAAEVQVVAETTGSGEAFSADQTIDFLGGGETQQLTFVVPTDPAQNELRIAVTSFAEP